MKKRLVPHERIGQGAPVFTAHIQTYRVWNLHEKSKPIPGEWHVTIHLSEGEGRKKYIFVKVKEAIRNLLGLQVKGDHKFEYEKIR